jgi:hypothetical protein
MDLEEWCLWYKRRGLGRLRRLLMRHWDPIGVNGVPEARGEYDSYLGLIAGSLRSDWPVDSVADQLQSIRTKTMEVRARRDADLRVAQTLKDWYAKELARAID